MADPGAMLAQSAAAGATGATMSEADEIRALTEELERLGSEAGSRQDEAAAAVNQARQTEIRARLAALGRPVG